MRRQRSGSIRNQTGWERARIGRTRGSTGKVLVFWYGDKIRPGGKMIMRGGSMGGDERGKGARVRLPLGRKLGGKRGGWGRTEYLAT